VPAGQNFVITSVEITPMSNTVALAPNYVYFMGRTHLSYTNFGWFQIKFQRRFSTQPESWWRPVPPLGVGSIDCDIFIHGYLTAA